MTSPPAGLNVSEGLQPRKGRRPADRCTGLGERRPRPHGGKAAVVWEETGQGPTRAAGGGGRARRERCAETTSGRALSPQGLPATGPDPVVRGRPRHEKGGGRAHEPVGARKVGEGPLPWCLTSWRARSQRARAQGRWALGSSRSPRTLSGRGTVERRWKQTRACRGVCGAALKLRALWEGHHREAKVRTGLGTSTVRERRGACGNVDYGGMRHPPRVSKERGLETLHLKLCARNLSRPSLNW